MEDKKRRSSYNFSIKPMRVEAPVLPQKKDKKDKGAK
jgi:hypothetical protein